MNAELKDCVDIALAFDEINMIKKEVRQAKSMGTEMYIYLSGSGNSKSDKEKAWESLRETCLKEECKSIGITYARNPPFQSSEGPEGDRTLTS